MECFFLFDLHNSGYCLNHHYKDNNTGTIQAAVQHEKIGDLLIRVRQLQDQGEHASKNEWDQPEHNLNKQEMKCILHLFN